MQRKNLTLLVVLLSSLIGVAAGSREGGPLRDLWIHPRGDSYDPQRHYRAPGGELYYSAENDIASGVDSIVVHGGSKPRISAELGPDIWRFVERNSGSLRVYVHYDSDGDGRVDRTVRGRIENDTAIFDSPKLAEADLRHGVWQMGIVYKASTGGVKEFDGRYLASVQSKDAKLVFPRVEELASVDAGPVVAPGLVILKHREGAPLDFADFARRPEAYLADFEPLTREEDADDWTVVEDDGEVEGTLRTHFEREDLFYVRVEGGDELDLEIVWGDMPVREFLETRLAVEPDSDGCYSTLESRVTGDDGSQGPVPHRLLYCPDASLVLFDAPDGYQIFLSAVKGEETLETTEASTSIADNFRLYAKQVYRRSPRTRATGAVLPNIEAGFVDAGHDLWDAGRHLITGEYRTNIHTGQKQYRASPITALPRMIWRLGRLEPLQAVGEIFNGANSAVQIAADGVSAVNNAVVNPLVQGTLGLASPQAADTTGHWFGAASQAWAQNLPLSERSGDALNPFSLWYHNRAFAKTAYTRTDTQLNIDRVLTIANIVALNLIIADSNGSGNNDDKAASTRGRGGRNVNPNPGPPSPTPTPPPPTPTPTPTPPPILCE